MTRYRTIVADPPWPHNDALFSTRTRAGVTRKYPLPYPVMAPAAIAMIDVHQWAESDARLFLWATNRYLPAAFGIIEAWGFSYRQTLVWHKTDASPFTGSVAPNAEFLLVGVRGAPARIAKLPNAVVSHVQSKSHSRKPDAFLDMVEQVSPGPYLELFARRQRLGWDTWGNEAFDHTNGALAHKGEARTAPAVPEQAQATEATP